MLYKNVNSQNSHNKLIGKKWLDIHLTGKPSSWRILAHCALSIIKQLSMKDCLTDTKAIKDNATEGVEHPWLGNTHNKI